jgi:hypothetical protein
MYLRPCPTRIYGENRGGSGEPIKIKVGKTPSIQGFANPEDLRLKLNSVEPS